MQPKIYLLEDNPVFQTLVIKQLEHLSQDVQVYTSGESFLVDLHSQPDLVILDYQLEGNLNGYDILKEIKKLSSPPPVVFFSGNMELTITASILKLGVVEYIEKSIFTLSRLKDCISQVLKSSMGITAA
jgi:CheY-like chemotaxis protein